MEAPTLSFPLTFSLTDGLKPLGNSAGFNPLSPTFYAPFADAGAGVATLTLTNGTGSATFSRASAASTVLSTGLIGNVSSGSPRSRYDPASLAYQGYIGEQSASNLCLQSEDFGTTWAAIGTPTRSAGAATCGVVVLDLIGDDSAVAAEGYTQTIALTGNAGKSVSFFFKQGTSTSTEVRLRDTTAPANKLLCAITWSAGVPSITMTTGTLLQILGPFGVSGVYRAEMLANSVTATNTHVLEFYPASDAALAVLGTGDIYIGGVMVMNDIRYSASYIKTTSSSVVTSGDSLTYPSSGNISGLVGAVYAECSSATTNATVQRIFVDPGNAGRPLLQVASAAALTTIAMNDGTTTITKSGLSSVLNTPRKRAAAWGGTTMSVTGDGAAVASGAFDGDFSPTNITAIRSSAGGGFMIKELKIWQNKPTDTQLVSLTA